jgi:GMP synthase-like glutamine amidotransferase
MSVNDGYAWIAQEIELIREANRLDIPLIGHCFGSQLIAKAFGAPVMKNRVKEIGWGWLSVADRTLASEWLGQDTPKVIRSFQWHGDTFELPDDARLLLTNDFCTNQAYVLRDLHLGMQSHLEMTPELVRKCAAKGGKEVEAELRKIDPGAVEPIESMLEDLDARTAEINATMRRLYDRWTVNLRA